MEISSGVAFRVHYCTCYYVILFTLLFILACIIMSEGELSRSVAMLMSSPAYGIYCMATQAFASNWIYHQGSTSLLLVTTMN